MNIAFFDGIPWDYDVATPLERALGGSQSALCYLAIALAQRGHAVTTYTATNRPRIVEGVRCLSLQDLPSHAFAEPYDAFIVLNGPAEFSLAMRPHLHPHTPLVLWTQHAVDQPAMLALDRAEIRAAWDAIVAVSQWHRQTIVERFAVPASAVWVARNAMGSSFHRLFTGPEELVAAKAGPPVLAYTSTPFRGLHLLLQMWEHVRGEFPGAILEVFSSMKVYQQEEAQDPYAPLYARARSMPGVVFHGSIPQSALAAALRRSSILAYPNIFAETSCIAVMESLAAGACVVSSALGALPETGGGRAILVDASGVPAAQGPFAHRYLIALLEVLRQRSADPAAFSAARWEQVEWMNRENTWQQRALDWEGFIHDWGQHVPGMRQGARSPAAISTAAPPAAATRRMSVSDALALARNHLSAGRLADVEAITSAIVGAAPEEAEAWALRAMAAEAGGHPTEAAQWMRQAVVLAPSRVDFLNNLGIYQQQLGEYSAAERSARAALALAPNTPQPLNTLATALQRIRRWDEAEAIYRQLLQVAPEIPEVHNNLGTVLNELGRIPEAVTALERAVELRPGYASAWSNLGVNLQALGRWEEAMAAHRKAVDAGPDSATSWNNFASLLLALGRLADAEAAVRRSLALQPDHLRAATNLVLILQRAGRLDACEEAAREAIARHPHRAELHAALANGELLQGRVEEAWASFSQAIDLSPDDPGLGSKALVCQQYLPGVTAAGLSEVHQAWERRFAVPLKEHWRPHTNSRDPRRRLRIGFVSEDLGQHPVGWFLLPVLQSCRREECEITCYSDRIVHDVLTRQIHAQVERWRDTAGLSDAALAEQIRADEIDLLFDLGGHTSARMLLFARKPAPLQLAWIAYPGTTGLTAIDYVLADSYQVPEGTEGFYAERILRLPRDYICYAPADDAPAVGILPAETQGWVTFGSFNNPGKINSAVVRVWATILQRVPRSRLRMKFRGLDDPGTARHFKQRFAEQGIGPERIELEGHGVHGQLLSRYNQVDLALDPFPYSGGLTTCESLWMGVPVVTCPGATFAGRHSLSHLSNAGLTETIVDNFEAYVECAVALANDWPRLAEIRRTLRPRMETSALCDVTGFSRDWLAALHRVWDEWCRRW